MKITISKLEIAKSQLCEAITLFFEERDPVSIHTLVGAALQVLNDHIDANTAKSNHLILHYENVFIKEDKRKFWVNKINEARNFFKHADKDIKKNKTEIRFETNNNSLFILEAIRCLSIIEGKSFKFPPEILLFWGWFIIKNPDLIQKDTLPSEVLKMSEDIKGNSLSLWLETLNALKHKPVRHYT